MSLHTKILMQPIIGYKILCLTDKNKTIESILLYMIAKLK